MSQICKFIGPGLALLALIACAREPAAAGQAAGATSTRPATVVTMADAESPTPASAAGGPPAASPAASSVVINGRPLSAAQLNALVGAYGFSPPPGRYWYDALSGAWGVQGREALGFILPGHDFGPLSANASGGNTGVFINGRQLNLVEAATIQQTFGAVYAGRWWLDGRSGYFGVEGNPAPVGNLIALIQARSNRGGGGDGDNFWSSRTAVGNSSGGCSYVAVGGTTASSGCD